MSIFATLPSIKHAALEYIQADREDDEWPEIESNFHCVAAEPERILDMVQALEQFQQLPTDEEMAALAKLVRDLAGYIKMTAGDKPDPAREDLLQQAKMLLGMTGL